MQRKDLFLLTFLLSQTAPLWAMDDELSKNSAYSSVQATSVATTAAAPRVYRDTDQAVDVRAKILKTLASVKSLKESNSSGPLAPESKDLILYIAPILNGEITQAIETILKPRAMNICNHQINAYRSKDVLTGQDNLTALQENVGTLKAAYDLLKGQTPEGLVQFPLSLNKFFNLSSPDDPNVIKEGVEALVSLKALANEVTDAREAWTHAVETTLDEIYGLLSKKVPLLMAKVSDIIDTIKNKKVVRTCYEISQSNDHEKNIEELNRHLDAITKAISIFETPENIESFTKPLQDVLLLGKDAADVLETNIKVLMIFKKIYPEVFLHTSDPFSSWSQSLESSKRDIVAAINQKTTLMAEKTRVKEEMCARDAREETTRKAMEEQGEQIRELFQKHREMEARPAVDYQRITDLVLENERKANIQRAESLAAIEQLGQDHAEERRLVEERFQQQQDGYERAINQLQGQYRDALQAAAAAAEELRQAREEMARSTQQVGELTRLATQQQNVSVQQQEVIEQLTADSQRLDAAVVEYQGQLIAVEQQRSVDQRAHLAAIEQLTRTHNAAIVRLQAAHQQEQRTLQREIDRLQVALRAAEARLGGVENERNTLRTQVKQKDLVIEGYKKTKGKIEVAPKPIPPVVQPAVPKAGAPKTVVPPVAPVATKPAPVAPVVSAKPVVPVQAKPAAKPVAPVAPVAKPEPVVPAAKPAARPVSPATPAVNKPAPALAKPAIPVAAKPAAPAKLVASVAKPAAPVTTPAVNKPAPALAKPAIPVAAKPAAPATPVASVAKPAAPKQSVAKTPAAQAQPVKQPVVQKPTPATLGKGSAPKPGNVPAKRKQ